MGTYFIYIFFVVIGVPASIPLIVEKAPLLILFVLIVGLSNLIVGLLLGKVFKIELEHILLASNATVGDLRQQARWRLLKDGEVWLVLSW